MEVQEKESTRFTYDVFLSFRGEDTPHTFVGHLHKELSRRGIHTFFDDKGEIISPALSNAIDESKILMVVFSENYASSTWCLDELVKILECRRDNKQLVFPIFYHVNPSDIRKQENSYANAMMQHENRFGKCSQKVQEWRLALTEASNLPGYHINTGYETISIEEIFEEVYRNIGPKPLYSGQNPVGLGPRIEEVKSMLEMKPTDKTVRILDWEEYPSNSFPSKLHPKDIIVLYLRKSYLILEKLFKKFSCLTDMNLSHNQSITEIPDVSELQNLRKLRLDNCRNLIVVHESVGLLKRLVHLSASECSKLKNFLQRMFLPHLEVLDLNLCVRLEHFPEIMELQKIPECINLRILNVYHCDKLEDIPELPSTTQKVDARYCFSLTSETLDMLWSQAAKGIHGLEVVMPQIEIPNWFHFIHKGDNPHFWVRGKFPLLSLALVFQGRATQYTRHQLVELHLVINGKCVPCKGYYNFRIAADHVLICDLRVLFSEEEWLGLDALLDSDWNGVRVLYEAASTLRLTCWGVYVHKDGITSMEDIQFMCPDPKYLDMSLALLPKKDPEQKRRKMIEDSCPDENFDGVLMETMDEEERDDIVYTYEDFAMEQLHNLLRHLKEIHKKGRDELQSKGSALEDKDSILTSLVDVFSNIKLSPETRFLKDLVLIPAGDKGKWEIREASSSGHLQGREDEQHNDPQQLKIRREIYYDGITDALLEAQNKFPSLDIIKTSSAAFNNGGAVAWTPEGYEMLPTVEMRTYISGILTGLREAKVRFPDLDIWATLNTVASRRGIKAPFVAPPAAPHLDWTTVMPPSL